MDEHLKNTLINLANRYENEAFLKDDPSQFMHRYKQKSDREIMAFIAANLAFGKREQILSHVELICANIASYAGGSPTLWVQNGGYRNFFADSSASFYRMMSFATMRLFCDTLRALLLRYGSLEEAVYSAYKSDMQKPLHQSIASLFPKECKIISHGKNSASKRLQMFLRWMVRSPSPVDIGLWASWYDKARLLMPLDTHVMQQSVTLGLIATSAAGNIPAPTLRLSERLTEKMAQVFPGDPVRADYALFGLGVNKSLKSSIV